TCPHEWIIATANLANLWAYEQSPMETDPKVKLRLAIEAYEQALSLLQQDPAALKSPEVQYKLAQMQASLGGVYSNEALESEMQLDKAKDCYAEAGKVFTEDKYPMGWAQNQTEMGLVLVKQSRAQENQQEAVGLLDDAIKGFTDALKVYQPKADARHWALTTAYLADAYREKGRKTDDQKMKWELLRDAVVGADAVMAHAPASCPDLDLAKVRQLCGDTYYDAGLLAGNNRRVLLGKARDAYQAALSTWNQYHYAFKQRAAQERLRNAQNAL
ncbi:MAG: hypothetical protein ACJ74G_04930, partial [Blastocatellia bacterium]